MNRSRYLKITGWLFVIFIVVAFGSKAITDPERLARYTPLVTIHGLLMLSWFVLFAWQAKLIHAGNAATHQKVGRAAWTLVSVMLISGLYISFKVMIEHDSSEVFVANSFMVIQFLAFFAAALFAIRNNDRESHKRYMVFASLAIIFPAMGRFTDAFFGNEMLSLPMILIATIAIPIAYDKHLQQPVHRATKIGMTASILWTALLLGAVFSPLGDAILNLVKS